MCSNRLGWPFAERTCRAAISFSMHHEPVRRYVLAERLEAALRPRLIQPTTAIVLTPKQLDQVVTNVPLGWDEDADEFDHHIIFVDATVTVRQLLEGLYFDPNVERVEGARWVIYWAIRRDKRSHTALTTLARSDAHRHMTIRSYSLTRRLRELADAES